MNSQAPLCLHKGWRLARARLPRLSRWEGFRTPPGIPRSTHTPWRKVIQDLKRSELPSPWTGKSFPKTNYISGTNQKGPSLGQLSTGAGIWPARGSHSWLLLRLYREITGECVQTLWRCQLLLASQSQRNHRLFKIPFLFLFLGIHFRSFWSIQMVFSLEGETRGLFPT